MTILYFDCFSGISGDMVIGALIDAGADPVQMESELKKLDINEEYKLSWRKVNKNGITAMKFDVELSGQAAESHGEDVSQSHELIPSNEPEYSPQHHDHLHDHSHHRSYKTIVEMIEAAGFRDKVTVMALAIFKKIGEAEGKIHGLPLDEVHFHEVGAADSIVDIIGAAILIDQLGITSIYCSPIPTGSGHVHIAHGTYPVPAPATLEILKGSRIAGTSVKSELTTPTGAAIAAVLAEKYGPLPSMTVEKIGYGAGTKTFSDRPNVLRVVIGKE